MGYAGATTAGIARAAGVTQPLIHHHFGSKDGLWRAAVDAVFSNVPRLVPGADGSPAHETLTNVIERFVRFVAAHPEVTRIETTFRAWKQHFKMEDVPAGSRAQVEVLLYARLLFITLFEVHYLAGWDYHLHQQSRSSSCWAPAAISST